MKASATAALIRLTAGVVLFSIGLAVQAQSYFFTFTSGGMDATGTINISGGIAQSGSINVTGVPLEANPSQLITAGGFLLPASGATDVRNHDGDVMTYDNVANPANDPILGGNGLGFGSGPYQDSVHYNTLINLWGNSPGSYSLFVGEAQVDGSGNVIGDAQWVYHIDSGTLTLTPAVPEPSNYALILCALTVGFVAIRRRASA